MMNDISYQRWLALGLLVLLILLVIFVAIVPLVSTGLDYYDQKQELAFRLHRSKQIVAQKENVDNNIERVKQQYQSQNYFSSRETESLASADLQKFIKSIISQTGGQLTSTQVLPSTNKHGFNRITVKIRMSSDIDILRSVLHEIETSVPVKIIDQLDIRPVRGRRNRKTRKVEPSNKMNVNFKVTSFMREKPNDK